jgi:uncharacterized protein (DUF1778 family)
VVEWRSLETYGQTVTFGDKTVVAGKETVMPRAVLKDDVIQIRAPREAKALIMRAAGLKHQKLSEFVLDSARRSAEDTILDTALFRLSAEGHDRFVALLDAPPQPSAAAMSRFRRKPAWEA